MPGGTLSWALPSPHGGGCSLPWPLTAAFAVALGVWAVVTRGEGLTSRRSLIRPSEVRAELLWLWGQGDPGNTA